MVHVSEARQDCQHHHPRPVLPPCPGRRSQWAWRHNAHLHLHESSRAACVPSGVPNGVPSPSAPSSERGEGGRADRLVEKLTIPLACVNPMRSSSDSAPEGRSLLGMIATLEHCDSPSKHSRLSPATTCNAGPPIPLASRRAKQPTTVITRQCALQWGRVAAHKRVSRQALLVARDLDHYSAAASA